MKITDHVIQLDCAAHSHVFLILGDERMLVDTGLPGLAGRILAETEALGVAPGSIGKILLTHHDVDHIGNAKRLQEATGAELWAPGEDVPYIVGDRKRPGIKRLIGLLANRRIPVLTGAYVSGQRFGGVTVLSAPGHTPGHSVFRFENVIFTGDLFRYGHGRFRLLPGFMNWDVSKVRESLAVLKTLEFEWLCPSHGEPVRNGPALRDFLAAF